MLENIPRKRPYLSCVFRFYIWEILHSTIRKMNKHVLKIHKELEDTKARLARQHKRVSSLLGILNYLLSEVRQTCMQSK